MSNYTKGYRFERRCAKTLEAMGFFVIRSAGSHGSFDLVALKPRTVWLVQCKVNREDLSKTERKALKRLAESLEARAVLAYRKGKKIVWEDFGERG
jgi:Holliday junction resolvase